MTANYRTFPGFEHVYLEDSYVLSIDTSDHVLFSLDMVLLEGHTLYTPPKPGEQHCYVKAGILFTQVASFRWIEQRMSATTEPDGSVDYGNIDSFVEKGGHYSLEGDWGRLEIASRPPTITIF